MSSHCDLSQFADAFGEVPLAGREKAWLLIWWLKNPLTIIERHLVAHSVLR